VGAWVLQSLAHCDRVGKRKIQRLPPLPFPELLTWVYTAARHCTDCIEDKAKEFRTSSLLLMEAVMENALKTRSFPTGSIQIVMADVSALTAGARDSCEVESGDLATAEANDPLSHSVDLATAEALPYSVLFLAVSKMCKAYSELKASQREESFLHQPMGDLVRDAATSLSQLRKKAPEGVGLHPRLVSSFSLLLRTCPPSDPALLAKSMKVARWFSDLFCSEESLCTAVSNPSMLFSVVDVLSLSVARTGGDAEGDVTHITLSDSWSKMLTLLRGVLKTGLELSGGSDECLTELCRGGVEGRGSGGGCERLRGVHRSLSRLCGGLTRLVSAADRDKTVDMFQILHRESCEEVCGALTVCHCWAVVLGAKLGPDSQRELRRWHTKILLQCESLVIQHRGVVPVVIMSLNITTRLVALPTKVGLDSRLVLMSLHQTAVTADVSEIKSKSGCVAVLESVGRLLLTLLKHHSSVATSCPGPIITTTNSIRLSLTHTRTLLAFALM
jgi:hypothetical protein